MTFVTRFFAVSNQKTVFCSGILNKDFLFNIEFLKKVPFLATNPEKTGNIGNIFQLADYQ